MASALSPHWKHEKTARLILGLCLVIYAALTIFQPHNASSDRYNLTDIQIFLLELTIIIPIAVIWIMAFYGAAHFKRYSELISGSPEAPAIRLIANGLVITLAYLVLNAVLGAALPYLIGSPAHHALLIVRDYVAAATAISALILLYLGSDRLHRIAQFATWTPSTILLLVGYLIFSGLFVWGFLTFTPYRAADAQSAAAVVPPTILLFSLILPYLLSWFLGLLSGVNIIRYAKYVKGSIYKKALHDLVLGIWSVVFLVMVLQALSFASRNLAHLGLGAVLILIYVLLVLYGLGFLFVRSGAKKLARLEVTE